jgi:hypothetical protein
MTLNELFTAYNNKFAFRDDETGERIGECVYIPWDGFPDEETKNAFFEAIEVCIERDEPLTEEQRRRFFPLEFMEIPKGTYY